MVSARAALRGRGGGRPADLDGDAPAGNYRLVFWHEKVGFKDGKVGRFCTLVAVVAGKDVMMALPAVPFDVR
ncbi:hypothetical protein [Urbifossiella limnaea]|uniref:Uncharacterized protein n=1 Tax=Urbifossiella limnaea TaxID=2528023 RepID=A0A517XNJ7_9BACT|nr:hypothetical protein [Urbifossiella limnaea]QDU19079.1 hypothetical protein ETAA1_09820 [Urbifossiella limnaea]